MTDTEAVRLLRCVCGHPGQHHHPDGPCDVDECQCDDFEPAAP